MEAEPSSGGTEKVVKNPSADPGFRAGRAERFLLPASKRIHFPEDGVAKQIGGGFGVPRGDRVQFRSAPAPFLVPGLEEEKPVRMGYRYWIKQGGPDDAGDGRGRSDAEGES